MRSRFTAPKKKKSKNDRFDISLNINIDNVDRIINLTDPQRIQNYMNDSIPFEANELARYIAEKLDDMGELSFHIRKVRKHSRDVILTIFKHVIEKPQSEINTNRKRYYNYSIGLYERTGKLPRD